MKLARYLILFGLVLFLASSVSATESCLSERKCDLCPGDKNTPMYYTLKIEGVKNCEDDSPSELNGETNLVQYAQDWGKCMYYTPGGDGYPIYTELFILNNGGLRVNVISGDTMYFQFNPTSCTETMETGFLSDISCDSSVNKNPLYVYGGTAILTPCKKPEPEIEIDFQNNYILETKKLRGFTPKKPITPYDDVTCKAIVKIPGGLTEEQDSIFVKDVFNLFKDAKADLIVVDEEGKEFGKIASTTKMEFSFKESVINKKMVFVWDISGWGGGWTSDQDMINRIVSKKKIDCVIVSDGVTYKLDKPEPTSNCVSIAGPDGITKDDKGNIVPAADFKVVNMRGKSANKNPSWLIVTSIDDYSNKYSKIDPFKAYIKNFAFYADIKEHDDFSWTTYNRIIFAEPSKFFASTEIDKRKNAFLQIPIISSCDSASMHIFYNERTYWAYAPYNSKFIFQNPSVALGMGVIHETGHALAGLLDEYVFNKTYSSLGIGEKNCVKNPASSLPTGFKWGDIMYGDSTWNNLGKGCDRYKGFYVPSITSIMSGKHRVAKFNVVSCIYIVQKILKIKFGEAASLCASDSMNTIKTNKVCLLDSHCTLDDSEGCATCDLSENKCVYANPGSFCEVYDPVAFKTRYGVCGRRDTPESKAYCNINPSWECDPTDSSISGCVTRGFNILCVSCSDEKKCVAKNEGGACTKREGSNSWDGFCRSGRCEVGLAS